MINFDLEFTSARRNRNAWSNPCLFEVPLSGIGQRSNLSALDPVSDQTPSIRWLGKTISVLVEVVAVTASSVTVSTRSDATARSDNYYRGSQLKNFRVDSSIFLSTKESIDYVQLSVANSNLQLKDKVFLKVSEVPGTIYVPSGKDLPNAYAGQYLCNDTKGGSVVIRAYDSEFHKVVADIPAEWGPTDAYNIRAKLPAVGRHSCDGTTLTTIKLGTTAHPGDFVRVVDTNETVVVTGFDDAGDTAFVSPAFSAAFPAGTLVDVSKVTGDNFKTMSCSTTAFGQYEQAAYEIHLVSGTVPNVLLAEKGGYPSDYPFLYVEFYDTNLPSQNVLFSNGHANKSYFKVTTPTGQVLDRKEKFTKVTGDLNRKIVRFSSTGNFRISWRLPSGEVVKFKEPDTSSPHFPDDMLQTSVMFSLKRA